MFMESVIMKTEMVNIKIIEQNLLKIFTKNFSPIIQRKG